MSTVATAPLIVDPASGKLRCPNGHDSAIPPRCPALMFVACRHHGSDLERVLHCVWCPPCAVQDLLAHVSHGWPGSAAQELLWVLRGKDAYSEGISMSMGHGVPKLVGTAANLSSVYF